MNNNKEKKLTFWGTSPIIFLLTVLFAIPIVMLNYIFKPNIEISFIPHQVLIILAIILLCVGIPLYIYSKKIEKCVYRRKVDY